LSTTERKDWYKLTKATRAKIIASYDIHAQQHESTPLIEELDHQSQDDTFYDAEASIHSSSSEEESDNDDENKDAAIARLEAHITRLKNSKSKSRKKVTFKSENKDNDKNL